MRTFIRVQDREGGEWPRFEANVDRIDLLGVMRSDEGGGWFVGAVMSNDYDTTRLSPAYPTEDEAMVALNTMRNAMGIICHDVNWPEPSAAVVPQVAVEEVEDGPEGTEAAAEPGETSDGGV